MLEFMWAIHAGSSTASSMEFNLMGRCPGRFLYISIDISIYICTFCGFFLFILVGVFSNGNVDQCVLTLSLLVIK